MHDFIQKYGELPQNYHWYLFLPGALFTLSTWTHMLEQRENSVDPDQMGGEGTLFPYSNISINGLWRSQSLD